MTCRPFGVYAGLRSRSDLSFRMRRGGDPVAATVHRLTLPSAFVRWKTSCRPLGDHAGRESTAPVTRAVTTFRFVPSALITAICALVQSPVFSSIVAQRLNAIWRPLGDHAGDPCSEAPPGRARTPVPSLDITRR